MSFIIFCFAITENKSQTIKKDPISGKCQVQISKQLQQQGKKLNTLKFDRKKFDKQIVKLKKITKLHTMFENMHKSELKASKDRALKQKQKLQIAQLERVKLFGKPTHFYKAPFVNKPENSLSSANPLVSNVLINGKVHDSVSVGDPFNLTFSFAPNSITAAVNVYIDLDNNGVVSPGDLLLSTGLVMDNSDYDNDPAVGKYKMIFQKEDLYSSIVSSLIFEVNDYQSVSYAVLTVNQKPTSSVIHGALNLPFKDIIVLVETPTSATYVFTDSAGKFSANIDRQETNQAFFSLFDLSGISNGYIPPSNQYISITSDTTNLNLSYTLAKSFIEGYAKDQNGAPINNVKIEADGVHFTMFSQTDSTGYYKLGVDLGSIYIYTSISWTNDYLKTDPTSVDISQDGTVQQDFLIMKSNCTISGKVLNNSSGIEGIPVIASSDSLYNRVITSQDGNYSLPLFKPSSGTVSYYVSPSVAPGYYVITPAWQGVPPAQNVNFEIKQISGGVKGTITDSRTGKPIANSSISFSGNSYKTVSSDEDGYYWASLLDGQYSMSVSANYYNTYYHDQYDIIINGSVITINITLNHSGSLSGSVKDEYGKPLYNANIIASDNLGNWSYGYPDLQGNYVISPLVSSNYKASASMNGYITQWYDKVSTQDSASLISVIDGYDTPNINFVLSKGGSISGKIVDKLGNGIPDAAVEVYDTLFNSGAYGYADSSGFYTVTGLNSGKYYVRTFSQFYIDQWYDGVTEQDKAKLIAVVINKNTPNINFTLSKGSSISGFVKDKYNNSISNAEIILADSVFNVIYENTDYLGNYSINQIQPYKKYYVSANAYGFVQQWYNNVSTPDSATAIVLLPEENKNNINFNLHSGGIITGIILDDSGSPLPYVSVSVEDSSGTYFNYGYSDYQGFYSIGALPPGKYYAGANDYYHAPQWFNHKPSRLQADIIYVMEDQTIQNINFDLSKPLSDSIIVKLTLANIPDTLRFSKSYISDYSFDYWWGVSFDVDGDINTGSNGCEIEIALTHVKYPGDLEFVSNIIDGTSHTLIEWVGNTGYTLHSDVSVRIDPSDKNTLLLTVPKSWIEIYQMASQTRYCANSSYFYSNSQAYYDYTNVGKDMVPISDPVGDVPFSFIDIVSVGWSIKTIENIPASKTQPVDFKLEQNYPNPFNPSTKIRYALPYESNVKIIVYNVLGQIVKEIVNEIQKTGYHEVNFNAANLSSGVYFYSITGSSTSNKQEFKDVKKMLLLK